MNEWLSYTGKGGSADGGEMRPLPPSPPWREFLRPDSRSSSWRERGDAYQIDDTAAARVNAALYLRRPLLVTGEPGTGKSSLAYSVAAELGLGRVLRWPIGSKTTLRDGLYRYDAIGRLQEANLREIEARADEGRAASVDIGSYIRLGPLGTALLPTAQPRVLLVDEFDKSDIDLPNDLLDVFEEGEYEIPELARLPAEHGPVHVMTVDPGVSPAIELGQVRCDAFPLVIITSNGEREFPSAFMRRCLRLDLKPAGPDKLAQIVGAHLGAVVQDRSQDLITEFMNRRTHGELATDQLLNAIFLRYSGLRPPGETPEQLADLVMHYLNRPSP
jgi:MoxR-like ATPase